MLLPTHCLSSKDRSPKGTIALSHLNLVLNYPGLEDTSTSMLMTYRNEGGNVTRNIFVYAETGKVYSLVYFSNGHPNGCVNACNKNGSLYGTGVERNRREPVGVRFLHQIYP